MSEDKTIEKQVEIVKKIITGIAKFQDEMKKMGIKCKTSIDVTEVEEKEREGK